MITRFSLLILLITAFAGQAESLPETSSPKADDTLFGLTMGLPLSTIRTDYHPTPSPFKQPDSYLIPHPPKPSTRFPVIVVTATEKVGLCAVSGSFAGERESMATVSAMMELVSQTTKLYGEPANRADGLLVWNLASPTESGIARVTIQTDQISETITLISMIYYLKNYGDCQSEKERSDQKT